MPLCAVQTDFKRDATGSDKRYSFRLLTNNTATSVHLFESAVDLLSYATYLKYESRVYKAENLLSLSGVYQPKKEMEQSRIPIALRTFLKENPHIKTIFLHLDNDKTGRLCTQTLKILLEKTTKSLMTHRLSVRTPTIFCCPTWESPLPFLIVKGVIPVDCLADLHSENYTKFN